LADEVVALMAACAAIAAIAERAGVVDVLLHRKDDVPELGHAVAAAVGEGRGRGDERGRAQREEGQTGPEGPARRGTDESSPCSWYLAGSARGRENLTGEFAEARRRATVVTRQ